MALAAARLWHGRRSVEIEQLEIRTAADIERHPSQKWCRFVHRPADGNCTIRSPPTT